MTKPNNYEFPREIDQKYLDEMTRQTRRVVYPDDWTPVQTK